MGRVREKHAGLELLVRRLVFSLGYRYRLHGCDLPGDPDLVFRKRYEVIFVHGWTRSRTGSTIIGRASRKRCPR